MDQRIAKLKKHVSSGTRPEAAFELLDLADTEPAAEKALQELAEIGRTAAKKAISRLRERRENEPLRRMADRVKEHYHTPVRVCADDGESAVAEESAVARGSIVDANTIRRLVRPG